MKLDRLLFLTAVLCSLSISMSIVSTERIVDFNFDDPDINAIIDDPNINYNVTRQTDQQDVITLLLEVGAIDLLKQFLFKRTNPLNSRSLLDYPLFVRYDRPKHRIGIDLFFNKTNRMYFNHKSSNIDSYLNITNPDFIAALENVFTKLGQLAPDFDPQFFSTLPLLFETFTVEERRLGLMIFGTRQCSKGQLSIFAPWYYLERNYFVGPQQETLIRETLADAQQSVAGMPPQPVNNTSEVAFQEQYLISDKLGIGDTRVMFDWPMVEERDWEMRLGIFSTVPTAFAFAKGLKGDHFSPPYPRPEINLLDIINEALNATDFTETAIFDFLLGSLSNLSAMLLEAPLGNGGHLGLGVYLKNITPLRTWLSQRWARYITWNSFMSVEYQFPAQETRFFITQNDAEAFAQQNFSSDDPIQVNCNFNFLTNKIVERFYPYALPVRILPGFIFRSSSRFTYEKKRRGFSLGTDTYLRTAERIRDVKICTDLDTPLNRRVASKPLVYMSKIFATVFWKLKQPGRLWFLSLNLDTTWSTSGIGPDYMATFKFDVNF